MKVHSIQLVDASVVMDAMYDHNLFRDEYSSNNSK